MDFIQSSNKQVDKFGPGKHGFSAGNPAGGVLATFLTPDWCDDIQQELINLLDAGGIVPAAATRNQLLLALRAAGVFTTPAQFDNTTKAATTAHVQRALGSLSGYGNYVASAALTIADVGRLTLYSGATAAQTLTLPAVAGLTAGAGIRFQNIASVPVTLKGNAAESINSVGIGSGASAANTLVLGVGESTYLIFDGGASGWREQQGGRSSAMGYLGCAAQSWQDVSASRTQGVTYTNSTGRPIAVAAGGTASGAAGYYTISVAGVTVMQTEVVTSGRFSLFAIVPPGANYSLNKGGADTYASPIWAELR